MDSKETAVDTVVIGAGQSGLAMSHRLSERNVEHVVLERARVGERWRTERWDSLRFQFPNSYVRLPGFAYDGDDPTGYMGSEGVVTVLERYANHIDAPIRSGVDVRSLDRVDDGFAVGCDGFRFRARNVVVATGPYQRPVIPPLSTDLPTNITQLAASGFTNAEALPPGAVLIVGSGASGVQIAEDLVASGREVYLCVGKHRRVPRRHRGRDIVDWFEELGLLGTPVGERPVADNSPLLTGVDGGYDVDLRSLAGSGARLLGRLEGVAGGDLLLAGDLLHDIAVGDESYRQAVSLIDARIAALGEGAGALPPEPSLEVGPMPPASPGSLNIESAGISSVIWATGYRLDLSWVNCGRFEADGSPEHDRGVSPVPGLYFLGLPFLHSARSSVLWGVGDDAEHLADHLITR